MVEREKVIKKYSIELETVTPVAVGSGELLSPYTDYVFKGDDILVLDKEKFARILAQKDRGRSPGDARLMDEYVNMIYGEMHNNRSNFNLKKHFIENPSRADMEADEIRLYSSPYYGLNPRDRKEIKCIVKDNGRPYIPGSSMKGAIKAALLYHWFKNDGKHQFREILEKIDQTYGRVSGKIRDIELIASRGSRNRLDWTDQKKINALKRDIAFGARKDLDKKFKGEIEDFLTKEHRFLTREFSNFRISDTNPILDDVMMFLRTERLHYTKGKAVIPVSTEAIKSECLSDFSIGLVPRFNHKAMQFLQGKTPIEELFKIINQFSRDNIEMELRLLDAFPGFRESRGYDRDLFEDYKEQLENLQHKIKGAKSTEAFFCVGSGKSYFYNSIGLAIYQADNDMPGLYKKFFKLYFLGKEGQKNFPLTRPVTDIGEPLGWVRIGLKN